MDLEIETKKKFVTRPFFCRLIFAIIGFFAGFQRRGGGQCLRFIFNSIFSLYALHFIE